MKIFKSHFSYDRRQRNGVFILILIIIGLQSFFYLADFSKENTSAVSQEQLNEFQRELDSLKLLDSKKKELTFYPFNPNFISDFKGYQLGMSVEEIDRLFEFRKTNKFVNTASEFQLVTQVSDSLLAEISPYFKFPDWVNTQEEKKDQSPKSKNAIFNKIQIVDLNKATSEDLIVVNGIGEKLAARIINYREKLQGFSVNEQLYEVWNLDSLVVIKTLDRFQVLSKPDFEKLNVNDASFKELLNIVYIDYELTKKILNYKEEVAEIQSIEELKKIDGFPLEKFNRIALYLRAK